MRGSLMIRYGLTYVLALFALVVAADLALSQSKVYRSILTRRCVAVELPDGHDGDCSALPDTYETIWVK